MEFPLVLIVSNKIMDVREIVPILDLVKKTKRSLVIFSEDMQQDPLSTMIYNNSKNIVKCVAVNVPWMANIQKDIMKDIATLTGATIIDNEHGIKLEDVKIEHFGGAKKIVVDGYQSHVIGGSGNEDLISERIQEIAKQIQTETSSHLKSVHRDRYSRMTAKIAEIEVGGGTDSGKGEVRDIIIDSLNSAKAAM